ncbi:MAG: hypothetical protein HFG54_12565 [Lachnospiraceae bacterium]|nr:hypothetical protein [Lachnospiraceae bacterium]
MEEKIYGFFTKGESEGEWDVTIVLPEDMADFFCVESQWDMTLETKEDLKWAAIEKIKEEAGEETDWELYDRFCEYLEDEKNWEGDVEEGEILEGREAAEWLISRNRPAKERN